MRSPTPHSPREPAADVALVILAAGRSARLGGEPPEPFRRLGDRPVYAWSMESARSSLDLGQVILVVPTDRREELAAALGSVALPGPKVEVVAGGPRRADSVRAALRALGDGGLGPVGARADIAAHCVALLVPAGE